jgi:polyisoprenoid-binding protein YceI
MKVSTIAQTREALPTGAWQIDPTHSQVGFAVEYMVGTFRGSFAPVDARLDVDQDGAATLVGSARVEDIAVQDENLNAHLLSPEFFDAERTPEIRFDSSEISRSGDDVVVVGDLTIKGLTTPVELRGTISDPITDAYGRQRVGLRLEGVVDRTSFGLDWNVPLPSGDPALANDVTLTAELYLIGA